MSFASIRFEERNFEGAIAEDVDGDGGVDLVAADSFGNPARARLLVHRRLGPETLAPPYILDLNLVTQNSGFVPKEFRDVDTDGVRDVLLVGGSDAGTLFFVLNEGDGTFGPRSTTLSAGAGTLQGWDFGDVDADGDLDAVLSSHDAAGRGLVRLYQRTDRAALTSSFAYSPASGPTGPVVFGDWNSDGHVDIALGARATYLPNIGGGAFGLPVAFGPSFTATTLKALDVDGDLDTDIVAIGSRLWVIRNQGGGVFSEWSVPLAGPATRVCEADMDRDGRPDFVIAVQGRCYTARLQANGTYVLASVPSLTFVRDLQVGDVNGDGWPDVLVKKLDQFSVLLGDSNGGLQPGSPRGLQSGHDALLYDLDEDQRLDLIVPVPRRGFAWYQGIGNGSFDRVPAPPTFAWSFGAPRAVDLDIDGQPEIVDLTDESPLKIDVRVACNTIPTSTTVPGYVSALDYGDFDADGRVDIVIVYRVGVTRAVAVYFQSATDFTFGSPRVLADDLPAVEEVRVADVDGDGDLDVVHDGWSTSLVMHLNDGTGHFPANAFLDVERWNPLLVLAAEFNGDSRADFFLGDPPQLFVSQGAGAWVAQPELATAAIAFGDFNGDGTMDYVGGHRRLEILLNNGNARFTPTIYAEVDFPAAYVADFNNDGWLDVVAVSAVDNRTDINDVKILANRHDGTFEVQADLRTPRVRAFPVPYDFDCDDKVDLGTAERIYLNRTGAVTPIWVTDLHAVTCGSSICLEWSLSDHALQHVRSVRVLRGLAPEGPFEDVDLGGLAPTPRMQFEDAAPPQTVVWYRLVFETNSGAYAIRTISTDPRTHASAATALRSVMARSDEITVHYSLRSPSTVQLDLFDVRGRRLRTWIADASPQGEHVHVFDARYPTRLANGLYFVHFRAGGVRGSQKIVVVR